MEERVREILARRFSTATVDLETMPSGRVTGTFVWDGFVGGKSDEDDDMVARQQTIRRVLREELGPDAQYVGVLLTYTPDEINEMAAV